jgi:23S rRNA (guanosine2251-2'-O)-methyltransferase
MKQLSLEDLGRKSPEEFAKSPKLRVAIVCDNLRSAHNVGALFRTADGFEIMHIHLCGITVTPPNNEIHKSALGAEYTVPWTYWEKTISCVSFLKNNDYQIVALEQTDCSLLLPKLPNFDEKPIALVVGNEVKGIAAEVLNTCNAAIEIPMRGTKHSLNVSVAAGITLWELFKKLSSPGG